MKSWVVAFKSTSQQPRYFYEDGGQMFVWDNGGAVQHWRETSQTAKEYARASSSKVKPSHARGTYGPGEYHPRVWRPVSARREPPISDEASAGTRQALAGLLVSFREVCRHIEAHKQNDQTFSHELRHLLLLSSTEAEAACKAVLRENGYTKKGNWNIVDYRKLASLMRLNEWEIRLARHPAYPPLRPFRAWRTGKTLPWYQAYNAVKHDRESALPLATFRNAITALAGALVLALAQFGPDAMGYERFFGQKSWWSFDPDFRAFAVTRWPTWHPRQLYVPPVAKHEWVPLKLSPRFI